VLGEDDAAVERQCRLAFGLGATRLVAESDSKKGTQGALVKVDERDGVLGAAFAVVEQHSVLRVTEGWVRMETVSGHDVCLQGSAPHSGRPQRNGTRRRDQEQGRCTRILNLPSRPPLLAVPPNGCTVPDMSIHRTLTALAAAGALLTTGATVHAQDDPPVRETPAQGCMAVGFAVALISSALQPDGSIAFVHDVTVNNATGSPVTLLPHNAGPGDTSMLFVAGPGVSTTRLNWTLREEYWEGTGRYQDAIESVSGMSFGPNWEPRLPGCDEPTNATNGGSTWNVNWPLGRFSPDVSFAAGTGTLQLAPGEQRTVDVTSGIVSDFAPLDPSTVQVLNPGTLLADPVGDGSVVFTAPAGSPPGTTQVALEVCNTAQFCSRFSWEVTVVAAPTPPAVTNPIPPTPPADTEGAAPVTADEGRASFTTIVTGVSLVVALLLLAWFLLAARRRRRGHDDVDDRY
jgi:hypothetical protein